MRYSFDADLGWDKGVSTKHSVQLQMGLEIGEFLRGRDITATLATNQGIIRKEVQRIVIEEILPKVFSEAGARSVGGELNMDTHSRTKGHAKMIEHRTPEGIDVEVRDRLSIVLDITTDRPVTALEAMHGSNISLADAITNDIMMHLAHKYLGVTDHNISTNSSVRNGELVDYDAKHRGNGSDRN